jgi:hypothetical protein
VYVYAGTFTMIEGTISGNKTTGTGSYGNGGGVYVDYNVTFAMRGGTIGDNKANASGGGVHVVSGGDFQMSGGIISGNIAADSGGGVCVFSGNFQKERGYSAVIYGNDADTRSNNIATSGSGHAVYVSTFTGSDKRDATAEAEDYLDSATPGPPGGWELFSGYIQSLINAASPGDIIALPGGTYDMTDQVMIDNIIIITTEPGAEVILKRNSAFKGDMIKVDNGGLTLDVDSGGSLILDGNDALVAADGSLVRVEGGGNLTMENGITLRNNETTGNGGGVYFDGTVFNMNGGTIGGSATVNKAYSGGGVYVNGGTFTMSGSAAVSFNHASGGNSSTDGGGGVHVNSGDFIMNDFAAISENTTAGNGGGVRVDNNGNFTMNDDAAVRDNHVNNVGGGVSVESGTFTMNGGTISGHTIGAQGGGVRLNTGTFDMYGGTISSNTAAQGGGVSVSGTFNMSGGTIGSNEAIEGGGVHVNGGAFTKVGGGTIYGSNGGSDKNTADTDTDGHAVYYSPGYPNNYYCNGTLDDTAVGDISTGDSMPPTSGSTNGNWTKK